MMEYFALGRLAEHGVEPYPGTIRVKKKRGRPGMALT
jgi:hypothetical protein